MRSNAFPNIKILCPRCAFHFNWHTRPSFRIFTHAASSYEPSLSIKRRYETKTKWANTFSRQEPSAIQRAQIDAEKLKQHVLSELANMRGMVAGPSYKAKIGLINKSHRELFEKWIEKIQKEVNGWKSEQMDAKNKVFDGWLQRRLWVYYVKHYKSGIASQLRFVLQDYIANRNFNLREISRQARVADLRFPAEWFPKTRQIDRKIHLHIGPTNSGKTYHALQRLLKAERGIYAGPLRLLAHEVHARMLANGRSCNMITGDERIISEDPECSLISSTVEMVPKNVDFDVAVIDEIQMIADRERGWAWTEAFLGLSAKEIHLCGEARVRPLIEQLVASTCDTLTVHDYSRLSPLEVGSTSLDNVKNVRPGDCLVAFSRRTIHALRHHVGKATGRKVAVVYGSLPPETRAEQARLFNDPESGYDILVASNAIGMGLNLSIKRIIFTSITKFNGTEVIPLATTEIKQIGGRAGRYRMSHEQMNVMENMDQTETSVNTTIVPDLGTVGQTGTTNQAAPGVVTCLRSEDLAYVHEHMQKEPKPIFAAGLKIPDDIIVRYASYFPPGTPLSYIMTRLYDIARLSGRYFLNDMTDEIEVLDAIANVEGISIEDRLTICVAPVNLEKPNVRQCLIAMARSVAESRVVDIFDLPIPIAVLSLPIDASLTTLASLEQLHQCLTLYMWLSFRFIGVFGSQPLAQHTRSLTEQRISETLTALAESGKIEDVPMKFASRIKTTSKETFEVEGSQGHGVRELSDGMAERRNDLPRPVLSSSIISKAIKADHHS